MAAVSRERSLAVAENVTRRFDSFKSKFSRLDFEAASQHPFDPSDPIAQIAAPVLDSGKLRESELKLLTFVRDLNREMFKSIDPEGEWSIKSWSKPLESGQPQGGGVMSVVRGPVLEKSAVNMSVVWGPSYPSIEREYSGKPYLAAGVSLISHTYNPEAPIAHMNVRLLKVGEGEGSLFWMGGGGDLTPMQRYEEDTSSFHQAFKAACETHRLGDYPRFKAWCDEYFFIPHRGETRGVGGVFFDYLNVERADDLGLLLNVGQAFAHSYGEILKRRVGMAFSDELKDKQLHWRGRYAEFNLVHDRGTRFGLMSGGNIEAIFASLPPVVKW